MMQFNLFGKMLIITGGVIMLIGFFLLFTDKVPFLGKLPGDIHLHKGNATFYFPLTSCILISVVVTALMWLFSKR